MVLVKDTHLIDFVKPPATGEDGGAFRKWCGERPLCF